MLASVPHGLRGQPSNRQLDASLRARLTTLMQTTYAGFNDVHLTEKLRELHGLAVGRASVRRLRADPGPTAATAASGHNAVAARERRRYKGPR